MEHLIEFRGDEVSEEFVGQGLMTWILKRLQGQKGSPAFDGTRLYSAEILSIILQSSNKNRKALGEVDGIDILLQQLAVRVYGVLYSSGFAGSSWGWGGVQTSE